MNWSLYSGLGFRIFGFVKAFSGLGKLHVRGLYNGQVCFAPFRTLNPKPLYNGQVCFAPSVSRA